MYHFRKYDRYNALLFLSGPSHSSDSMRSMVSILTYCLSGSVSMVGWPCRYRGCGHGFSVVCMYVCMLVKVYDVSFSSLSVLRHVQTY